MLLLHLFAFSSILSGHLYTQLDNKLWMYKSINYAAENYSPEPDLMRVDTSSQLLSSSKPDVQT